MSAIAVYMEGGGDSADAKALLRQGISEFLRSLREAARQKRLHWRVVSLVAAGMLRTMRF
jgi:hypothetical protein